MQWRGGTIVAFGLGALGCIVKIDPFDPGVADGTADEDTGAVDGPTTLDSGEEADTGESPTSVGEDETQDTFETGFPDTGDSGPIDSGEVGESDEFEGSDGFEDTEGVDLGTGCESLPSIDPRRSLIETNPEALLGISMEQVLTQAAVTGDLVADPQFTYTRLVDSFNLGAQAALPGGSHCDDTSINGVPTLGGYPLECPRIEGGQVGNLDAWFPIAAVNRFDLAANDGSDCGEQRLIFANNQQGRMLVIFEARIPNPDPSCGLAACRPILDFWVGLSDIDDPNDRAEQLGMAYLEGHPALSEAGFEPFMAGVNLTFGTGQIRSNSFDQDPWTLRQFRYVSEGEHLGVVAVPVTANLFGPLWNDLGSEPQGPACRQSILDNLGTLLVDKPAAMGMMVDESCFAGESRNDETADYASHLQAGSGSFEAALAIRLAQLGSDLNPVELANRATFAVGCMGCHEVATGMDLGNGLFAPSSLGFVHIDEFSQEPCSGGPCFAISPALDQLFLPARLNVMELFFEQLGCDASCTGGDPDALGLLLAGPATSGIPSIAAGTEQLLAWERSLRAGLSDMTLSGRPRGAH